MSTKEQTPTLLEAAPQAAQEAKDQQSSGPRSHSSTSRPTPVTSPSAPSPIALNQPELKLQFSRAMTRRKVKTVLIDPGKFNRVFEQLYYSLDNCLDGLIVNPIAFDAFLQVCRILIFKRLQDIYEIQHGYRPDDNLKLNRAIRVPQPLGELLYALGPFYADWNGINYHTEVIPKPAPAESWRTISPENLTKFNNLIALCEPRYRMVLFPTMTQRVGQPLMFVTKVADGALEGCVGPGMVAQPADVFLRFVHEDFYKEVLFPANSCEYVLTDMMYPDVIISQYITSYNIHPTR